ncbi:hypothetical protein ACD661_11770 [Legionella lytica]|uniref:Uncharacterized protein n=1 Tax=Legionella lytica TaxID=96232 RepID=A0ABW8DCE3_9GAMM
MSLLGATLGWFRHLYAAKNQKSAAHQFEKGVQTLPLFKGKRVDTEKYALLNDQKLVTSPIAGAFGPYNFLKKITIQD